MSRSQHIINQVDRTMIFHSVQITIDGDLASFICSGGKVYIGGCIGSRYERVDVDVFESTYIQRFVHPGYYLCAVDSNLIC